MPFQSLVKKSTLFLHDNIIPKIKKDISIKRICTFVINKNNTSYQIQVFIINPHFSVVRVKKPPIDRGSLFLFTINLFKLLEFLFPYLL